MRSRSGLTRGCCCIIAVAAILAAAGRSQAQLVISAISGNGGGSATAPNGDFVEIFNQSCATVNLDPYSVQVASSTGTAWSVVNLPAFNLLPGQFFAVRLQTSATGIPFTADFTNPTAITIMTATSGKGAIVVGNTALTGACPAAGPEIIDFVRFQADAAGTVLCTENQVADATGITAANGGGEQRINPCVDTNNNRNDFAIVSGLLPRDSSQGANACSPQLAPNWGRCSDIPPSQSCMIMTEGGCDTAGGVFGGECSNCPLPGACCQPNGICALTQQAECEALGLGAIFQGDPVCPPAAGCAEAGRCCAPDGSTCTVLVQAACVAPNIWSPGTCQINYEVPNTDCTPNFVDISTTGTELLPWPTTDDSFINITLPFAFNFYGIPQTAASVGTNGWIAMGGPTAGGIPANAPLSGTQPNNAIYVYGDDLHMRGTGAAPEGHVHTQQFGSSPNSVFIIQWTNVDIFGTSQPNGMRNTFQVKLYEASGVIEMQYLSLNLAGQTPLPADVVIGVKESPTNFTEVSQSVVGAGPAAIIFAPNGGCTASITTVGSCCITNQPCSVQTQAACQLACGFYQGDGTTCATAPCDNQACCLPQGGCNDSLAGVCLAAGGAPQGSGTNCGTTNCPPAGKCCTATGGCTVSLQSTCQASGSTWELGLDCSSPCVVGACCDSGGGCTQLTEAGCTAAGGIRWTAATACTPNLCQGRCCAPDGSCFISVFNGCLSPNLYGGDGTACSPSNVCQGRCCLANGSCSVTGSGGCADIGGTFSLGLDCTSTTVVTFDNVGLLIPDSPGGFVQNIQNVTGLPTPIEDLDVDVFVRHTFFGDLIIIVEHLGTSVTIVDRPGVPVVSTVGCAANDPDIILDDEGVSLVEDLCGATTVPPSPPNYIPNNPLSAFDGLDPNGDWTIRISDNAGIDTGTLIRWSLHVANNAPVCPTGGCTCFGDMNGDGGVSGRDINLFAQCVASGGAGCPCADMNHSGSATSADVPAFITAVMTGICGP